MPDVRAAAPGREGALPAEGEIHLWVLPGIVKPVSLAAYEGVLSTSERLRERAFRDRSDADRFVAAHGGLRRVLASYTGSRPSALRFAPGPGKPALIGSPGAAEIRFNMSHAGSAVVVAVAVGKEVGVDVERTGLPIDVDGIAGICFSEAEQRLLAGCAGNEREEMFYAIWTRKEAYVKAVGRGMALDLRTVDLSSAPAMIDRWRVCDVPIPLEGYRGALAVEGPLALVLMFDRFGTGAPC